MNRELYPHQATALEMVRASLRGGRRRPMVGAPTGSGKTIMAAAITEGALRKGKKVLVTVPALSLVDQTVERLGEEGIAEIGVIQANHVLTDWSKPVQVASVQTLMRRRLPDADVVLVDEAHILFEFYRHWLGLPEWQAVPFIGLSATPWSKGLGKLYDDLLVPVTTEQLITQGYLSPFKVYAPAHPDLRGVKTIAGDYHEGDLAEAMSKGTLVADVVTTWVERGEGRPTICFAVTVAHAEKIQAQFRVAGIMAELIEAATPTQIRAQVARRFHAGETKIVVSVGCLTTGIDWDVRCIIMARPTKSEILFVQQIGRGLRTANGKSECLILDHSDTHLRLGFVTDIKHTMLDGGKHAEAAKKKEQAERLPRECPKCSYLKAVGVRVCPGCGFEAVAQCKVITKAGSLSEIDEVEHRANREQKQQWYSMLLYIQRQRGYKPGWTANQYRKKFAVWPKGMEERPIIPTSKVWSYVQSQMIRYAKGRANADAHPN